MNIFFESKSKSKVFCNEFLNDVCNSILAEAKNSAFLATL